MSKTLNRVFLMGNVGKDPEIRTTPSGVTVANFTLATTERFKGGDGNWQNKTEWHYLTAFNRTAEVVRDYVHKGSKVLVEGRIETQSWEKDAVKQYKTVIIVNDLTLLDGKPKEAQQQPSQNTQPEIDDSDLPF